MADRSYSNRELEAYFADPERRKPDNDHTGWFHRRFSNSEMASAFRALAWIAGVGLVFMFGVLGYLFSLRDELPPLNEIENPDFRLATIAYTADGVELARYARQNRAWVSYSDISPHVINALVATEDHRFYDHWGIDLFRTASIPFHVLLGDPQGGSTISQQLARNLYNKRIGYEVTLARKLKEWVTAVQLERRYTKEEIIEMYLNTVEFGFNAWGLEAGARTFFGKAPIELDELESATLVGMLNGITRYNPVRNPDNSRRRRNVVLGQMAKNGYLDPGFLDEHREDSVRTSYRSSELTASLAPYFAEHVRGWLNRWAAGNGYDVYEDGLVVYTTLDSRMQALAEAALQAQTVCLQAVVDFEWTRTSPGVWSENSCEYLEETGYEPFSQFWKSQPGLLDQLIRETPRYRSMRRSGSSPEDASTALRENETFIDSLKTSKTRLEAGFLALDPQSGYVKAWVGGRDLATDWFDHVDKAARQPGSTFKPFVYTAAIDNGWSPYYTLLDDSVHYVDVAGNVWSPGNTGGMSGQMMTLREGLAHSKNTITARLMLEVGPQEVAFIARRMGIQSPLDEVMSLALGTSDVTLLELSTAYSTLANGGLRYEPTAVTRIEDRAGNVLYEAAVAPQEALSEQTAYTMVDMLRGVITEGTGQRIRGQFGLTRHDLAGKTGTTQESADGWFMMMHPELVMGSWVGFNDRRFTFRTDWWGQGAHTALLIVGDFFRHLVDLEDSPIEESVRFPSPVTSFDPGVLAGPEDDGEARSRGRVGW